MPSPDRVDALKEKIKNQEIRLWDLETGFAMASGNPGGEPHNEPEPLPNGAPGYCICHKCESDRLSRMITETRYALTQLSAIYKAL